MAAKKRGPGQPPKFETPEQMQAAIDAYFEKCDNHTAEIVRGGRKITVKAPLPYTMTGLAIALGFESRSSLVNYKRRGKFLNTIRASRLRVEEAVEQKMLTSQGVVAGVIFNAKNNFGWVDRTEVDNTVREAKPLLGGKVGLPSEDDVEIDDEE